MNAGPADARRGLEGEAGPRACASRPDLPSADRPLIAHIIHRLDVGGLENGLINLLNHARAQRYRHAVVCMTDYSSFRERLRDPGVSLHALHKREGKDPAVYLRLWRLLRRLRPQLVHTRNLGTLDCAPIAALAGVGSRVHGEHGWDMPDLHGTSGKYRLLRRLCAPFLDRQIALSRDLERWLQADVGIDAGKIVQIYNGVDTARFRPSASAALPVASGVGPEHFVLGSVGRMHPVKDPLTLVRAFVQLVQDPAVRSRLRLVMIGDGPLRAEAIELLQAAGSAELAWLPGWRSDIEGLLRRFDLFVLPSLNEGISNTILEAMASGVPVLATRVGGNPELIVEGSTGLLFAAGDVPGLARGVRRYLDGPQLAAQHGAEGRAVVEAHFSLDTMVDRYLRVYGELLQAAPQTPAAAGAA